MCGSSCGHVGTNPTFHISSSHLIRQLKFLLEDSNFLLKLGDDGLEQVELRATVFQLAILVANGMSCQAEA